jgi:hypothetical protein
LATAVYPLFVIHSVAEVLFDLQLERCSGEQAYHETAFGDEMNAYLDLGFEPTVLGHLDALKSLLT